MSDTSEPPTPFEELLAPVYYFPRREDDDMADPTPGRSALEATLTAMETVADGALAQLYVRRFTNQLDEVAEAIASIPTEEGIKRFAFIGEMAKGFGKVLDGILPPGRHKRLCMTAMEEVMVRAWLALGCDEGKTNANDMVADDDG